MKKTIGLVLALALCLVLLTAAGAESVLETGYELIERKTHLFERLPEIHYGPESVVEYDAEHFAVFADPETGYWGVGLKAEYYPVNEGDVCSFEQPAVIVLDSIGYDNNRFENYDIRISIDRVTYASLDGTTVKEGTDVLGIFGYSRDMETIGLLSGWGCRLQRDENGTPMQDDGVWQVEDAAVYDTFGLCTEAEISVTAVRKDGSELDPKDVGWTKWIVADLDVLQSDITAEGYDPHYFDEQLILKDGFVYSYSVQQGHVLNIDGKVRVNDSIMGYGVKTGLSEGELAKRYASVQLQQDKMTAQVNWRGCGSEEAPARTELVFIGAEKIAEKETPAAETTDYIVRYLEEGTDKQLADPKTVNDKSVGTEVTEGAIEIENYDLVSETSQSKMLVRDANENVITFYYKRALADYEVQYLEEGTEKQLAEPKVEEDKPVGETVTENAIEITNYDLVSEASQSKTLVRDASENVITFYYKKATTDYTVRYLDNSTNKALAPDKSVKGQPVGETVTERAIEITDYDLVSEDSQDLTISRDADQNVIKFYYKRALADYEVQYLEEGTEKQLTEPKTVKAQAVGSSITEGAVEISNYDLVSEESQSITIARDPAQNEIIFYYKRAVSDYEVQYLEEGTEKQLAEPKVVEDEPVGETVTENAIEITNYDLVSEDPQDLTISRDADQNIIKFYYKRALADYEVQYLEEGTEKQLAEPKVVEDEPVGDSVTENAIEITNYDLVSEDPQDLTISRDADQNVIKFYYKRAVSDYEVQYLEEGTEKQLAEPKVVEDKPVGETVTECAIEITDYDLVSEDPQSLTISRDADQNVIKFYYKRALSDYTVYYLEEGTEKQLAKPKTVKAQTVGSIVSEDAIEINTYDLVSEDPQSITLVRDSAQNVITFYYKKALTDYTVKYLEEGTEEELAEPKMVKAQTVGSIVSEDAIEINTHDLVSEDPQSITLVRDSAQNVIKFYYKKAFTDYTVKYLEEGTDTPLAEPKVEKDQPVGETVSEDAVEITNYDLVSETPGSITLKRDADENVITFYYKHALTDYTVRYLEEGTETPLADPKSEKNQPVGSVVTEDAKEIENYDLVSEASQSKTLVRDASENVITFYYKKAISDYEVRYLEEGTEKQLAEPKVEEDKPVGDTVTETAIEVDNYDLVSESTQSIKLVRDASENVVIFYYKRALTDYTVRYLEEGTEKQLADPSGDKNKPVGETVTKAAIEIKNYDLVGEASQSIKLVRDANENVITFYYKEEQEVLLSYTVEYVDMMKYTSIAEISKARVAAPDRVEGVPYGSHIVRTYKDVKNGIPLAYTIERDLVKDNDVFIFMYFMTGGADIG